MTATPPVESARPLARHRARGVERRTRIAPRGQASGELVQQIVDHRDGLMAFFVNQLRDRQSAEDLTQDVLARALAHLDDLDPERPMWPWLLTIARNRLTDHYRRVGTSRELDEHPRVCEALSPCAAEGTGHEFEDPGTRLGEHQLLDRAMRPLTPRQRSALLLHDVHGWSSEQIAELHGRNRNAVHQLIHRARSRVRAEYERLSGGQGALGLLPWPMMWAAELVRRTASRSRRSIQTWQLSMPAIGESMAGVAVAASLSLSAGAMWAVEPATAQDDELPDLTDVELAASAEAAAPQLVAPEPEPTTSAKDIGTGEHQRLAAAISQAESEAYEAQRAAEEEAAAEETAEAEQRSLPDATEPANSADANVDPTLETSESQHVEDGTRIQSSTTTGATVGDTSVSREGTYAVESKCEGNTQEALCEAAETPTSAPTGDATKDNLDDTSGEKLQADADDSISDAEDYASDRHDETEQVESQVEEVEEFVTDDDCGPDDAVGSTCEDVKSLG